MSSPPPAAADFVVDTPGDAGDAAPGDGHCATAAAHCSLRAAVQEANARGGSTVVDLPAGTYRIGVAGSAAAQRAMASRPDEDLAQTGDIDVRATLEIRGAGAYASQIDGGDRTRLFEVAPGASLTLRGIGLVRGHAQGQARGDFDAGAVASAGTLTLEDCLVQANVGRSPGAIRSNGILTVRRTSFVSNRTAGPRNLPEGDGGALFIVGGSASIDDTIFLRNTTKSAGGAIVVNAGTVQIVRSRFLLNRAVSGGAVYVVAGTIGIERTTFERNQAEVGGALSVNRFDSPTEATVRMSTFDGNTATGRPVAGAGIAIEGGHVEVEASTFVHNRATAGGGAAVNLSWGELRVANSTFNLDGAIDPGDAIAAGEARFGERAEPYVATIDRSTLVAANARAVARATRLLPGDRFEIAGSIVVGSGAAACRGPEPESGGANVGDPSCGFTGETDRPAIPPASSPSASPLEGVSGPLGFPWLLGPLAAHGGPTLTRLPTPGGPAMDIGPSVGGCPSTDQRGVPRPQGAACDAGAAELVP